MKKYFQLLLLCFFSMATMSFAQDDSGDKKNDKDFQQAFFGAGLGFDYGGIGIKGEFLPTHWLGLFVGGGYNLADPAFNAGFSLKALTSKNVNPLFVAMYGYNAAIKIKSFGFFDSDLHRKTYYGVSIGGGVDVKFGSKGSKATFLLLVPFRSDSFQRDYDGLKEAGFEFNPDIIPVAFSVGCNFAIGHNNR